MTHDAYSTKRVTVWPEERDGVPGMAIEYQDGYRSWCPKAVYDRDYQPTDAMSFGHALHAMKQGKRVTRGYDGNNVLSLNADGEGILFECTGLVHSLSWPLKEKDMLAEDWMIVEDAQA